MRLRKALTASTKSTNNKNSPLQERQEKLPQFPLTIYLKECLVELDEETVQKVNKFDSLVFWNEEELTKFRIMGTPCLINELSLYEKIKHYTDVVITKIL